MSELDQQYAGRILFEVVTPEVAEDGSLVYPKISPHVASHGLEALDAEGNLVVAIEGHKFGKAEIEAAVKQLLAGSGDP